MNDIKKSKSPSGCWRCGGYVDHYSEFCIMCGAFNRKLSPEEIEARKNRYIEQLISGKIKETFITKEFVIVDGVKMTHEQYRSPEFQKELKRKQSNAMAKARAAKLKSAREKGTHTEKQWIAILEEFEYRCLRCGNVQDDGLTKDHIQAVARGGSDAIDNIQPLCRQCNSAQKQFNWIVWRRANGFGLGTNCFCWMRKIKMT